MTVRETRAATLQTSDEQREHNETSMRLAEQRAARARSRALAFMADERERLAAHASAA